MNSKRKRKFITLGPLDGEHFQEFANEFAEDGYELFYVSVDANGRFYGVMVLKETGNK